MLIQQYEAKLMRLERQNPAGTTNERKLWHGTANESVASINTYGFNRSYCGKNGNLTIKKSKKLTRLFFSHL